MWNRIATMVILDIQVDRHLGLILVTALLTPYSSSLGLYLLLWSVYIHDRASKDEAGGWWESPNHKQETPFH
jgi:hypothetical protein